MRTRKFVTAILSTSLLCTTFVMSLQSQAFARKVVIPVEGERCRVPGGGSKIGLCSEVCAGKKVEMIENNSYPTCGEPPIVIDIPPHRRPAPPKDNIYNGGAIHVK
jgi:hypothetical protein